MSHEIATVTTMSTLEENVSRRTITYDLYINGKYVATYNDVLQVVAARDAINNNSCKQGAGYQACAQ